MTSPRRLEQDLPVLLGELYLAGTPDYRDDLVRQTARVRQRPAWTFPERWLPMELVTTRVPTTRLPWRQLGVLAIIAILLAAMLAVYVGSQQSRVPAPFGPAANGVVAYSAEGDIYVADPTTGDARTIVGGSETDLRPIFSPDGTKIAFERQVEAGGGLGHLYVARSDGSAPIQVTTEPLLVTESGVGAPLSVLARRPIAGGGRTTRGRTVRPVPGGDRWHRRSQAGPRKRQRKGQVGDRTDLPPARRSRNLVRRHRSGSV